MKNSKINRMTFCSLGMACVFVGTLIMIPTTTGGYINLGDGFILLFSSFLTPFCGFLVGGVASALVDFLSGYIIYAPYTLLIKGLEGMIVAYLFTNKQINKLFVYIVATLIMIFGYFLATWNITQNILVSFSTIVESIIQGLAGIGVAYLLHDRLYLFIKKYTKIN